MSTTTTATSALALLELRAGASDQDREAWLAQRKLGVTATEMRDLHLGKIRAEDLIADKLGRRSNAFAGNAYTAWGNAREPIIAAIAQQRYALAPESRLFRAADNPRFLCSPDGLGEDFEGNLLGEEIKTAGVPIPVGSDAFDKKGYLIQIVWSMIVTGARAWLYGWELRLDGEQGFEPGELHFEWVRWDDEIEALATVLVAEAEAFLIQLDAAAAEAYVAPDIDDDLDTHAVNYLRFLADEKEATAAKKSEWDAMLASLDAAGKSVRQEGVTARITYNPASASDSFVPDEDAAKAADPVLFEAARSAANAWAQHLAKYSKTVTTPGKASLTVTPIKPKADAK